MVGLALYTVTDNRDCVQRFALGRPIPTANEKPAAGAIYNHGAAVIS